MSSAFSSQRFSTLLLREWMQHKRGWLITLFLPIALFMLLLPFGQTDLPDEFALRITLFIMVFTALVNLAISWISAIFQVSGLARRDEQDRSIEFWLSLPASHSESIGATLLAHVVLVPLAALLVGALLSPLVAAGLLFKHGGADLLSSVPWSAALAALVPALLRACLGVLLVSLWLAPLVLITMVASAWLKRWGVPAVMLAVGVGGLVLDKAYGQPIIWRLIQAQTEGALGGLVADGDAIGQQIQSATGKPSLPLDAASLAWHDGLQALQNLASIHFVGGLIVAAGCFALLVYKRSRSH